MQTAINHFRYSFIAALLLTSCNMPGTESSESKVSIQSINLTQNGIFKIQGSVGAVKSVYIHDGNNPTELKVISKNNQTMEVGALSSLTLIPGKIYSLVVASAEASEVIPIQVESPKVGPQGAKGDAGPVGPAGAPGQQGPAGANGKGRSIVIKDGDGKVIAYFMGSYNIRGDYNEPSSNALIMLPTTGKIIGIDLSDGKMNTTHLMVYYSGTDCTGTPYTVQSNSNAHFQTLGHIYKAYGYRFFETVGFVGQTVVGSRKIWGTQGNQCTSMPGTVIGVGYGQRASQLQEVNDPVNTAGFEALAPLRLELE